MRQRSWPLFTLLLAAPLATAHAQTRRPLSSADVDDIATLEMLEDRRTFDSTALARLLQSSHPEVRRRAALATGRINDRRGIALLRARPLDRDTSVAATVVFAVGHLRDSSTVPWFDSLLANPRTPPTLLAEAASALGKIVTPSSREALSRFLTSTKASARTTAAIEDALLSIGRMQRGDIAPILPWTHSTNEEIRWRATWAFFRSRDPAAVARLLQLARDPSPVVRSWATRGLNKSQADSVGQGAAAKKQLFVSMKDPDRRVVTEAITALATYADSAAALPIVAALKSSDSWLAVSASTALPRMHQSWTIPALVDATSARRPCAVRITAMQALQTAAPSEFLRAVARVARDTVQYCQYTAYAALARAAATDTIDSSDRTALQAQLDSLRMERRRELRSLDPSRQVPSIRAMATWGDSNDLGLLRTMLANAQVDSSNAVASALTATITQIERRLSGEQQGQRGGRAGGGARTRPPIPERPLSDYRAIVERWIVPAYNGAPRPRARWSTPHGVIELELYPSEAPLAVDDFVRTMNAGYIVGTEFTRVVPDFVDQQQSIRPGNTLRDEVNRHRLSRGNLSWATSGLDTGTPGYTLNHTPQPHNEGNFTSMGHVVVGQDVVDRIQLGDRITSGRMLTPSR